MHHHSVQPVVQWCKAAVQRCRDSLLDLIQMFQVLTPSSGRSATPKGFRGLNHENLVKATLWTAGAARNKNAAGRQMMALTWRSTVTHGDLRRPRAKETRIEQNGYHAVIVA